MNNRPHLNSSRPAIIVHSYLSDVIYEKNTEINCGRYTNKPPDSAPDLPVSGPRPVTAECSLEFCCFQHLPASIFIITVSSASPKGPQDHFLLIFVKTRERSVYSKRCHELADAAGQAWGRRGQPVWGPPGAEAVVWPGRALACCRG